MHVRKLVFSQWIKIVTELKNSICTYKRVTGQKLFYCIKIKTLKFYVGVLIWEVLQISDERIMLILDKACESGSTSVHINLLSSFKSVMFYS